MRRPFRFRPFAPAGAFLVLAVALTLQASSAEAVQRIWFSAVSGSASNAALWNPAAPPIAGDIAQFSVVGGSYTVSWATPQDTCFNLDVLSAATPSFSVSGKLGVLNNFSISNGGRAWLGSGRISAGRLRVAGAGVGKLIVYGTGTEVRSRGATAATTFAETTGTSADVYVMAEAQLLCNSWVETARKSASSCSVVVNGGNLITKVGSRFATLGANVSGFRGDVFLSMLGTTYMDVSNGGVFDVKGNLVVGSRGKAVLRMYDTSPFLDPFMFVYGSTFVGYNTFDALLAAQGTLSIEGSTARLGGGLYLGDPDHVSGGADFGKLVTRGGSTIVGGTGILMPASLAGSIEMVGGTLQLLSGATNILQATPFSISSNFGSPLLWVNGTADLTVSQSGLDLNALGIGRGGAGRLRLAGGAVSVTSMRNTMIADSVGGAGILEVDSSAVFTGRGDMILGSGGQITVSNGGQLVLLPTPQEPITDLLTNGSITLNGGTISAYEGTFNGPGVISGHGSFIANQSSGWENRTSIVIPAPDTMKFQGSFTNRGGTISGGGTLDLDGNPVYLSGVVGANLRLAYGLLYPHEPFSYGDPRLRASRGVAVPAGVPSEAPLGHLHLQGNLFLSDLTSINLRIGSAADGLRDTLEVDSTANIGAGELHLTTIAGSFHAVGDTITLLTAGSIVGTFSQVFLDGELAGAQLQMIYTPTAVKAVFLGSTTGVGDGPHTGTLPTVLRFAAQRGQGTTAFVLDLPEAATVQLRLFDISGREVARLADDQLAAGRYSFPVRGHSLASGMYFARAWIDTRGQRRVMTARAPLIR